MTLRSMRTPEDHECVFESNDCDICPACKEHTEFCSECGSECCGEFPKEME